MEKLTKSDYRKYRLLEMLPGTLVWGTLILSTILSFIKPLWVIIFIILFDLYWLLKVFYLSTFLIISYRRLKATVKKDWLSKVKKHPSFQDAIHLIIFPTYGENFSIIDSTFHRLLQSNFPLEKCIIVVATEAADKKEGLVTAQKVQKKYEKHFKKFIITTHVLDKKTEIQGKGSNIAHAGREVKKYIDAEKIAYENVIVSVFDIDTQVHQEYLGYLTHAYLNHPNPTRSSYQPVPVFHNNIWDAPAIVRVASYGTTFWLMGEQIRPEKLFTFSSHSMSFKALVDVGFWSKNVVSEDSRIFIQCLLEYDGDYSMTPLYIPVSMDSVLSKTRLSTLAALYKQQRRWAWGCENIPFMLWNFAKNKKMKFRQKFRYIFTQVEGMHSWATAALLITLIGRLPLWFASETIETSVLFQNTPQLLNWMMNLALVGLILSVIFSTALLPPIPRKHGKIKYATVILQWALLPVSLIIFGSFPAIEAQTRLMIGRYLGFTVTEKTRKE